MIRRMMNGMSEAEIQVHRTLQRTIPLPVCVCVLYSVLSHHLLTVKNYNKYSSCAPASQRQAALLTSFL